MFTQLTILLIFFLGQPVKPHLPGMGNAGVILTDTSCKTETDSLTKEWVYTTADIPPQNEGGKAALMKQLERCISRDIKDIPADYDFHVIVAFIVDTDGSIKGERIIKDKTNQVAQEMLAVVRSFKWIPAKCNNRNVAMLYQLPLNIEIE